MTSNTRYPYRTTGLIWPSRGLECLLVALLLPMASTSEAQSDLATAEVDSTDRQQARIVGPLSTGEQPSPAPEATAPDFQILKTQVRRDGGRSIILQRVAAPNLTDASASSEPANTETLEELQNSAEFQQFSSEKGLSEFCMISATVIDRERTLVRWWPEGAEESYEAVSNVDFNYLGGFHEFEGRGQRYVFIMGLGNVSAENIKQEIPSLPSLQERGPVYMLTKGDAKKEEMTKVMDVLHDLYEVEEARLKEAFALREQRNREREEWLEANPPVPEDVVIRSWEIPTEGSSK